MLNEDATLNNFVNVGSAQFTPNFPVKFVMRLIQQVRDLRYVPSASATFSITFKLSDGTTLTKTPTFLDAGDRSLLTVSLSASETQLLIGQNLSVTVTDGSDVSAASLQNAIQNIHASMGC